MQLAADTQAKLRLSGDLLAVDFSVPEDAPAEFRSLSYGSRQAQLAPGAGKVVNTPNCLQERSDARHMTPHSTPITKQAALPKTASMIICLMHSQSPAQQLAG